MTKSILFFSHSNSNTAAGKIINIIVCNEYKIMECRSAECTADSSLDVVHNDEWKCYYIVTKPSVSGVYNPQVAPFTNMV